MRASASATAFDFQLFDRAQLYSADTRFVLSGIVNRMDRAYVAPASCGEIRLIYRLTRTNAAAIGEAARLAAAADDAERGVEGEGRARSTRRRRSPAPRSRGAGSRPAIWQLTGAELAAKADGAGRSARSDPARTISTASRPICRSRMRRNRRSRDFRTDYLLKVFDYDAQAQPLRKRRWKTRSIANASWRTIVWGASSRRGCSIPAHFAELDRGTILIPEKFLANGAIAPTPVGFRAVGPAAGLRSGAGRGAPIPSSAKRCRGGA